MWFTLRIRARHEEKLIKTTAPLSLPPSIRGLRLQRAACARGEPRVHEESRVCTRRAACARGEPRVHGESCVCTRQSAQKLNKHQRVSVTKQPDTKEPR
ncbi:hypothetical protein CgunFtcFv8_017250 [Champsocephalus gunnari]|nr:hypothetical protein CgunFtcFv8_017250 [Champsocephalus gunnari]